MHSNGVNWDEPTRVERSGHDECPTLLHMENTVNTSTLRRPLKQLAVSALLSLGLSFAAHAQAVDGEVRKVDVDAGKITLKHGEIRNLDMPAMQMAFRVADPAFLKKVNVGDKVSFTADKVNGQFTVTSIDVKK